MKLSRQELLVESRFADRCDRLIDGLDPRLLGGLGEVHGGMDEAGLDRPDEIGRGDAVHRRAHGVDLQQVADHHLRAERLQRVRPGILLVDHRAHAEPERQRLPHGRASRIAGRAGDRGLFSCGRRR